MEGAEGVGALLICAKSRSDCGTFLTDLQDVSLAQRLAVQAVSELYTSVVAFSGGSHRLPDIIKDTLRVLDFGNTALDRLRYDAGNTSGALFSIRNRTSEAQQELGEMKRRADSNVASELRQSAAFVAGLQQKASALLELLMGDAEAALSSFEFAKLPAGHGSGVVAPSGQ